MHPHTSQCCSRLKQGRFHAAFHTLELYIQHALTVFDSEGGKQLNYCQLLQQPTYKQAWSSSAADEFGRLVQGVSNRVKGTPNLATMSPVVALCAMSDLKKPLPTKHPLSSVGTSMYGLPQSGLLANELLDRLNQHRYFQSKLVPGLWPTKHDPSNLS
eukprot:CCRYP_003822-RA/>CCRYP_003822-RA protein AED:0.43 eAED:0.43 QI:0/0/0/1/1/1/2/0/157